MTLIFHKNIENIKSRTQKVENAHILHLFWEDLTFILDLAL